MRKLVNYDYVDLTAEEIEDLKLMGEKEVEEQKIKAEAEEKKKADKESGNQKLRDLGLTDYEISALIG